MNTRNFLCSPFIHVFLMVGCLLFALRCPASRDAGATPTTAVVESSDDASDALIAKTDAPAESPLNEPGRLPEQMPAKPLSAAISEKPLMFVANNDPPSPVVPVQYAAMSDPKPLAAPGGTPKGAPAATPKELRPPLDLLKENGENFVGWPKPLYALLITGKIEGYLEPCGCAGMERMKGGMGRRYSLFKQLRLQGWPVVGLDVGGLAHGFGRQAEFKFHRLIDGMRAMDYGAITLGETDLKLPAGELVAETADAQNQKSPFVSANVGLFGFESGMIAKSRILQAGGKKIGVTGVLGKSFQKEIQNAEIEFSDPEKAIEKVLPELKSVNLLVLLAHADMKESIALAKKFPQFNVVVTSGGNPIPPDEPTKIEGSKTILVEVGTKGMSAIVLGFFEEKEHILVRYQRVVLDSRQSFVEKGKQGIVSKDPPPQEMKNLMAAFQDQLKETGFEGLGLRAAPHPQKESGGKFVGTEKCKSCHEESYKVWKKSPHSKAYETLAKLDPPRNFDPECLSCHVVGWNPQRFFPYESGYQSEEKTPLMKDVGCEDCHGPGEFHCKAEEGGDQAKMDKYRKASVITKAESEKNQCRTCHDGDNSPDFNFQKYWPHVEHYENKDQ
jgi:hypothetical protein